MTSEAPAICEACESDYSAGRVCPECGTETCARCGWCDECASQTVTLGTDDSGSDVDPNPGWPRHPDGRKLSFSEVMELHGGQPWE
jgi:hypothetical protein